MNNSITLYKLPFTHSGIAQPYFMSEQARDNFLVDCPKFDANLQEPNIFIGRSFDISFVYPIDVSVSDDYNFALISYNGRKYYAYIIDCEMSSVGFTRFFCKRSFLFETVNYLSYFENFNISRFTLPFEKYYRNCKYYMPNDLRYVRENDILKFNLLNSEDNAGYLPCYVINCTPLPEPNDFKLNSIVNGEIPQYVSYIIPIPYNQYENPEYTPAVRINFTDEYGNGDGYKVDLINNLSVPSTAELLNLLSPYIINMSTIAIPCRIIQSNLYEGIEGKDEFLVDAYELPFGFDKKGYVVKTGVNYTIVAKGVYKINSTNTPINVRVKANPNYPFPNPIKFKVDLSTIIDKKGIEFSKLHLYFGALDNELVIDFNRYSTKSGISITIYFWYTVTVNGVTVHVSVSNANSGNTWEAKSSQTTRIGASKSKIYTYLLPVNDTYIISSEANFNAQNRYYNALCSNALMSNAVHGLIGSATEVSTGGLQKGMGADVMGVSNISRGIFGVADTFAQNAFQANEFELRAKQAKESPSSFNKCSDALTYNRTYGGVMMYSLELPCENDYDNFIKRGSVYGYDCNIYIDDIFELIGELSEFSFIGTAVPKERDLGNIYISEMSKYMSLNILYKIYK